MSDFFEASELVDGMRIHCLCRDVRYQMLNDKVFCETVMAKIPRPVLDGALLTQMEMAASMEGNGTSSDDQKAGP